MRLASEDLRTRLNRHLRTDFEDVTTPNGLIAQKVHGIGRHIEAVGKTVVWRNLRIEELP